MENTPVRVTEEEIPAIPPSTITEQKRTEIIKFIQFTGSEGPVDPKRIANVFGNAEKQLTYGQIAEIQVDVPFRDDDWRRRLGKETLAELGYPTATLDTLS